MPPNEVFNPGPIGSAFSWKFDTLVVAPGVDNTIATADPTRVYVGFFANGGTGFVVPGRAAVANIGFPITTILEFHFDEYVSLVGAEWHLFTGAGIANFSRLQLFYIGHN